MANQTSLDLGALNIPILNSKSYVKPISEKNFNQFKKAQNVADSFLEDQTLSNNELNPLTLDVTPDATPDATTTNSNATLKFPNLFDYNSNANADAGRCGTYVKLRLAKIGVNFGSNAWDIDANNKNHELTKVFGIDENALNQIKSEPDTLSKKTALSNYINAHPFDLNNLKEGQVVQLFNPNSNHFDEAFAGGNGLTHVGIVARNPETNELAIQSNIGGKVQTVPVQDFNTTTSFRIGSVYDTKGKTESQILKEGGKIDIPESQAYMTEDMKDVRDFLDDNPDQKEWMDNTIREVTKNKYTNYAEINYGTISTDENYNRARQRYNLANMIKGFRNGGRIFKGKLGMMLYQRYDDGDKFGPMHIYKKYEIQPGDTISKVMEIYGLSREQFNKLNPDNVNSDVIYAGQNLNVGTSYDDMTNDSTIPQTVEEFNKDANKLTNTIDKEEEKSYIKDGYSFAYPPKLDTDITYQTIDTLGYKNNNPGNLKYANQGWKGEIGENGGFSKFETIEDGIRAMMITVYGYGSHKINGKEGVGKLSVNGVVGKYAPAIENNTSAYAQKVAKALNVNPKTTLDISKNVPAFIKMIKAMLLQESGTVASTSYLKKLFKSIAYEKQFKEPRLKSGIHIDFSRILETK